jgi:Fe-S-cluster containining protein
MLSLSRPYASRYGRPVIERVDPRIYTDTFYGACMECRFCHDSCCQYGARVDPLWLERTADRAAELEALLGVGRERWFEDWFEPDPDYAGGRFSRTRVEGERCIFLNRAGRGCQLHRFALETGREVYDVKPMVCGTFPVLWENGVLNPALEVLEDSLVCRGPGPTLYQSAREALAYYFGDAFVAELDAQEAATLTEAGRGIAPTAIHLPLLADRGKNPE